MLKSKSYFEGVLCPVSQHSIETLWRWLYLTCFWGSGLGKSENPFREIVSLSQWLRENAFRRWCNAHEKGARRHANASDKANADQWRSCITNWTNITERTSPPHVNLTTYIQLRGDLRPTTLSNESWLRLNTQRTTSIDTLIFSAQAWEIV